MFRAIYAIPESQIISPDKKTKRVAKFCKICYEFFPLYALTHKHYTLLGKDHVQVTCSCEGSEFTEGAEWWEYAVVEIISDEQ